MAELFPTIAGIDHALKHGQQWMAPGTTPPSLWMQPASSRLLPQPQGEHGMVATEATRGGGRHWGFSG